MTQVDFDVIVIGGGPGGSCAAALARQRNLRTLVVEKAVFPRFRIGESLLPMGNAVLREIGAWPKIATAGFIPKHGAEFHTSDGTLSKHVVFAESLVPGLESAFQVERARFDTLLLEHARERGAEVRLNTTARSVEDIEGGQRVTLAESGVERAVTARWLIDSTGRDQTLMSDQKRRLDRSSLPKRVAIYSHFRGVARASGPEGGNIIIVRLSDGWFWLIPIDRERTSVGLVTGLHAFRSAKLSPEAYLQRAVAGSTKLRDLLGQSAPTMEFQVTSDYSYFRHSLARERVLLVGDTAGFLDPVFSSGVHLSTWSAKQAVERIARAHAENRGLTLREQQDYTRTIKRHARVFERLITAFYDDTSFDVFMCQKIPRHMSRAMTSIVAGHAHLTWPLWWRYHLFLLVCRLQRHWKVVKHPPAAPAQCGAAAATSTSGCP